MLFVKTIVVGQLRANCYLIFDSEMKEASIIDPGDDADYMTRVIADEKVNPTRIIATHGHFDHIMAASELQLAYNIPFLIHQKDEFLVKRMSETAEYFIGVKAGPSPRISANLEGGSKLSVGKSRIEIIETPGHTPGSISFYNKKAGFIWVGDLLFAGGGVGRTDFSYSNQSTLEHSIEKILRLPKETILYCGHGPESTVAAELPYHTTH